MTWTNPSRPFRTSANDIAWFTALAKAPSRRSTKPKTYYTSTIDWDMDAEKENANTNEVAEDGMLGEALADGAIILVVGFLHYFVFDQIPVIRFFLEFAVGLVSLVWIGDTDDNDYVASLTSALRFFPLLIPLSLVHTLPFTIFLLIFARRPTKWDALLFLLVAGVVPWIVMPLVEEALLVGNSMTPLQDHEGMEGHCPLHLMPADVGIFDFTQRADLGNTKGRDDSLAAALWVSYRALRQIPLPVDEEQFCRSDRALRRITPTPSKLPVDMRWVQCAHFSDDLPSPPNAKLQREFIEPLQVYRDASALSLHTYANIVLPHYNSWLAATTKTHDIISSRLTYGSYYFLDNPFSTPCEFNASHMVNYAPTPFFKAYIGLRCFLYEPLAIGLVQSIHPLAPPQRRSLRVHILPNFARDIDTWRADIPTNLEHVTPPARSLRRLPEQCDVPPIATPQREPHIQEEEPVVAIDGLSTSSNHSSSVVKPLRPLPEQPKPDQPNVPFLDHQIEKAQRELGISEAQAIDYNSLLSKDFSDDTEVAAADPLDHIDVRVSLDEALACVQWLIRDPVRGVRIPSQKMRDDHDDLLRRERKAAEISVLGSRGRRFDITASNTTWNGEEEKGWKGKGMDIVAWMGSKAMKLWESLGW
ncbi:hypothetical protein TI39_contig281g00006 [Zymoseptoria brevis]|uniref:Uncharacterized protein n=1 Tax=Zymoseptoria brevis TaxID=1047168 RepID=A0A0F4GW94_9PEZI|nr:hypothetical protein TI39_contig281g00006 [Zymoseptoria brevis]